MKAKLYSQAVGVVLLLVGAIGLFQHDLLGMDLSKRHSAVHLATGALLAFVGFTSASQGQTKNVVLILGAVYTILGLCGFFMEQVLPGFRIFHTDMLTNVVHLAIGVLGLAAAMMGGAKATAATS